MIPLQFLMTLPTPPYEPPWEPPYDPPPSPSSEDAVVATSSDVRTTGDLSETDPSWGSEL